MHSTAQHSTAQHSTRWVPLIGVIAALSVWSTNPAWADGEENGGVVIDETSSTEYFAADESTLDEYEAAWWDLVSTDPLGENSGESVDPLNDDGGESVDPYEQAWWDLAAEDSTESVEEPPTDEAPSDDEPTWWDAVIDGINAWLGQWEGTGI